MTTSQRTIWPLQFQAQIVLDVAHSGWTEVSRRCQLPRTLLTMGDLSTWDAQLQKPLLPALRPTLGTQGISEPPLACVPPVAGANLH